ncbi:hypothetical protein GOODEAATRI_003978 [Goodea atripinnis]|uniref:HERC3 n=1 Tax=Goodea atripinnis TaxID=208336 RepID=A0ABV0PV42_9TELE
MLCWGNARDGQLGIGEERNPAFEPRNCHVFSGRGLKEVACGGQHTLFLLHDGSVYTCGSNSCGQLGHNRDGTSPDGQLFTWGQNTNGQLGLGKGEPSKLSPHPLKSLAGIPLAQITAGGDHSFALSLSGAVFGWGKNRAGQLGLNDKQDRAVPCHIKFLRSQKVVYISCGDEHTAALTKVYHFSTVQ